MHGRCDVLTILMTWDEMKMGETLKRKNIPRRNILLDDVPSPFLLPDEAAKYLRLDERTLANYRSNKTGPVYRKHGGSICYHRDDLRKWSKVKAARV